MKIGELFNSWGTPERPWMYPFDKVKRDPAEGFYIDAKEVPELIDIDQVQAGDVITGDTLYRGILWEVSFVDDNNSLIYVKPSGENPFLTGVGAGGAIITEQDIEVFTGESEKKHVDLILKRIQSKQYADYNDVAYLLLGSNPVRFGPNGPEGGWYSIGGWSTRGYSKGLSDKDIMVKDAITLQKLGLDVPPKAISGELDIHEWNKLIGGSDELVDGVRLFCEDWNDPITIAEVILTHAQPQIKKRNVIALIDMARPFPREEFDATYKLYPDRDDNSTETDERRNEINEIQNKIRERWLGGYYSDPGLLELLGEVSINLFDIYHPTITIPEFDSYWHSKEYIINFAKDLGWTNVLHLYINAKDSTNRRYAAYGLSHNKDLVKLLEVASIEENPEVLEAILRGIEKLDRKIFYNILDSNLKRYQELMSPRDNDYNSYYRKEFSEYIKNSLRRRGF